MFGSSSRSNEKLNEQIDAVLASMTNYTPDSPEYPKLMKSLERLYKLKAKDEGPRLVKPDVIFTVAGNIVCVLIIVGYEHKHVIGSRAMTFVSRLTSRP